MWLLPAFLLRHIWLCQLDRSLYAVAVWSLFAHGAWFGLSCQASKLLHRYDRQQRGWTMLMSQGAMNSFLYPLLLGNDKFGEKSLACAVLWDLGGNMWICQFALFAIAAYFKPNSLGDDRDELELSAHNQEEGEQLLARTGFSRKLDKIIQPMEDAGIPQEILIDAMRQPILIACVFGFLLNIAGLSLPMVFDTALWLAGEPYKVILYFLVGFYGDHNLGSNDLQHLGQALGIRYAIAGFLIIFVFLVMPFEPIYRYTVALALLSPTSSLVIYLVGENRYDDRLLRLSVCGGFVSTMASSIMQSLLISIVST